MRLTTGAHRQAEGDVADAEDGFDAELFFDERERLQGLGGLLLLRARGHNEAVYEHVLARDSRGFRGRDDAARDFEARLGGLRHAVFVEREAEYRAAVFFRYREYRFEGFFFCR